MIESTYTIIIKNKDSKELSCVIREPGFDEYVMAISAIRLPGGGISMAKGGKFLLDTCWISGDEEIRKDAKMLYTASIQAASLLEIYDSDIKKN